MGQIKNIKLHIVTDIKSLTSTMANADALKDQGNKALQAEKFDEAISLHTEAIDIDATNHVFYSNRSAAYAGKGDYENALQDAKKTIELKSDYGVGYSRLGASLSYLGRNDEALEAYKTGLKHDPENTQLKAKHNMMSYYLNLFK